MLTSKRIAELHTAISLQGEVVAQAVATFRALEADEASLQDGITFQSKIDSLPRTDATLNVFRSAGRTPSPTHIVSLLHASHVQPVMWQSSTPGDHRPRSCRKHAGR